uniref:Putative secreted protein n=1 Tax=Ixodes ricinus TaxID=34613 RepID=A0A6B0U4N9_IXORI
MFVCFFSCLLDVRTIACFALPCLAQFLLPILCFVAYYRRFVCYAMPGHLEGRLHICCYCFPLSSAITSYFRLRLSF